MTVEQRFSYAIFLALVLHLALFTLPGIERQGSSRVNSPRRVSIRLIEPQVPAVALPEISLPEDAGTPVKPETQGGVQEKKAPAAVEIPAPVILEKEKPVLAEEISSRSQGAEKSAAQDKTVVSEPPVPLAESAREESTARPLADPAELSYEPPEENLVPERTPEVAVVSEAEPLYLQNPPPEYPRAAKRRNQQGVVVLEVLVNRSGMVDMVRVQASSGHSLLDRAAEKAVEKWVFVPARQGERAVDSRVLVPVRFDLRP